MSQNDVVLCQSAISSAQWTYVPSHLIVIVVSEATRSEEINSFVEEIVVKVWVRTFVVKNDRTRVHHLWRKERQSRAGNKMRPNWTYGHTDGQTDIRTYGRTDTIVEMHGRI